MPSLLISAPTILTMDRDMTVVDNGTVEIENGRIRRVVPTAQLSVPGPHTPHIRLQHHLLLPGLVNTHTHLPMSLLRGLADDMPLQQWLEKRIFPAEARVMTPGNVHMGSRLGMAEMLLSGTTTCADGYFHERVVLDAAAAQGMRGVFAQGVIDFPAPGLPDPRRALDIAREYLSAAPRTGRQAAALFAHSPYTCSANTLTRAKALCREFDALFFIHVAETRGEVEQCRATHAGLTPVRYLHSLRLLDAQTVLVHAVHTDAAEQDLIAASGAAVSVNTESNMKLGAGIAPVQQYLDRGIRVGLGTDSCASNNDLDLFQELSRTARLHKQHNHDPSVLPAEKVVRLATRDGAEVLGMGDHVGSIEPGKHADLIAVDLARPHAVPLYHPYSHLAYSASGADVDLVVIGGDVVVRDGRLVNGQLDELLAKIRELSAAIRAFPP